MGVGVSALMLAVAGGHGRQLGGPLLEGGDLLGREQIRQDEIALQLEHPKLLANRQARPIAVVDPGLGREIASHVLYPPHFRWLSRLGVSWSKRVDPAAVDATLRATSVGVSPQYLAEAR